MHKTGISVIVVSWNTKDITDRCLACLKKAVNYLPSKYDVEVIVVDNGSIDGSREMIVKKHPWVKLYNSSSNLGYAKGNNFGFKKTNNNFEYLLLLNSDAFIEDDTFIKSLEYFNSKPDCDVLGCQLHYKNGKFQPSGGYLPTPLSSSTWLLGIDHLPLIRNFLKPVHPKNPGFFAHDRQLGWVMGAFLFMKREVFEKTHGFDENFFMYMEEVEWCHRVNDLAYQIWYSPGFTITHVDKASSSINPEKLAGIFKLEILGLVYYLKKYYPRQIYLLLLIIKGAVFARFLIFTIMGNKIRSQGYLNTLKVL